MKYCVQAYIYHSFAGKVTSSLSDALIVVVAYLFAHLLTYLFTVCVAKPAQRWQLVGRRATANAERISG